MSLIIPTKNFHVKTDHPQEIIAVRYDNLERAISRAQRQVREREVGCAVVLTTEQSPIGELVYRIWRGLDNNIYEDKYRAF